MAAAVDRWSFVTSNVNKWQEASRISNAPLERVALELPELQAATITEVAVAKAEAAFAALGRPVIVEDSGIELGALGSFPGPFTKYWEQLGGLHSICRAADGLGDRTITAVCVLALCRGGDSITVEGRVTGTIAAAPRGSNGFGWDAIFIPDGDNRTFGELTSAEKDARSHRRLAWQRLSALPEFRASLGR